MKKIILAIAIFAAFSFTTTEEKSYAVKATVADWQKHINKLEVIRQIADGSDLSNQQVKFITRTIDSLEMLIVPQIKQQIADTLKKK